MTENVKQKTVSNETAFSALQILPLSIIMAILRTATTHFREDSWKSPEIGCFSRRTTGPQFCRYTNLFGIAFDIPAKFPEIPLRWKI
jgi:hypothetical protein